jgi:aspartate/methionine/tyrosine aminotransferase
VTSVRAPYMEWAKSRPRPAIDLAGSNLVPCTLDDLPGAREALDIAGESPFGYPPLVAAIAERHGVTADRVATAGGCSGANFLACAALLEPGDEVLSETPFYDPMPAAARLLGATVRTFARRFEDGYDLDPAAVRAALTPRTRLVLISNPHNPSGALARPESLAAVGELAAGRGIAVLVDEVYRETVLEGRPAPAATLSPAFVSTSSLTKAYGLASLRCGWTLACAELTERIRRVRDLVDNWAPMPSDRLAVVAFRNLDALAARARSIIEANAVNVSRWLAARPDVECVAPRATLAFPRLKGVADAGPLVEELFARTGTAVTPGLYFGAPAHFRIAFGGAPDRVARGLEELSAFLDGRAPA